MTRRALPSLLGLLALGCMEAEGPAPTLVVLPDTQCYSLFYPEILQAQGDFVVDNAAALDLRGAIHLGDITENNVPEQWAVAAAALAPIYDRMPLAIAPGNHDLGDGGTGGDRLTMMSGFFGLERARLVPGFVEAFDDGPENTAWEVSGDVHDYLLVGLEFAPRDAALDWAAGVLAAHPDHIGIVSTHAYLDGDGRRYDHLDASVQPFCPYEYGVSAVDANDGEEQFRRLIAPSSNVRLVLSGHVPNGFAYSVDATDAGAEVHQVLADYQTGTSCPMTGGDGRGYLLLLALNEHDTGVDVHLRAYSPVDDAYRTDHELRFSLAAP